MFIQILVDNPSSWIVPFAKELKQQLIKLSHEVTLVHNAKDIKKGDILCLLGCERIFEKLDLNKHNLVVHESYLPKGKGWSPLTWQVIEGEKEIPIALFEAVKEIDAGVIYYRDIIKLNGTELIDELRELQGKITIKLIMKFISNFENVRGVVQTGESTFYRKRGPGHSELNIDKSIREQINLLRVVDNEKYPAFFIYDNVKYILKINKATH